MWLVNKEVDGKKIEDGSVCTGLALQITTSNFSIKSSQASTHKSSDEGRDICDWRITYTMILPIQSTNLSPASQSPCLFCSFHLSFYCNIASLHTFLPILLLFAEAWNESLSFPSDRATFHALTCFSVHYLHKINILHSQNLSKPF